MASMTFQFLDVGQGDGTAVVMRSSNNLKDPGQIALVDLGEKRTPSKIPSQDAIKYLVGLIDTNSNGAGPPCSTRSSTRSSSPTRIPTTTTR